MDPALVRAGNDAVKEGRADSLSAWVNLALEERAAKERRLVAMERAIAAYEQEFSELTDHELLVQERVDRRAARIIRARRPTPVKVRRPRRPVHP